jgi:hypothetical protein
MLRFGYCPVVEYARGQEIIEGVYVAFVEDLLAIRRAAALFTASSLHVLLTPESDAALS